MKHEKKKRRRRRKTKVRSLDRSKAEKNEREKRKARTLRLSYDLRLCDPLPVSVGSFSSNVSLESPLEHGRPRDVPVVLLEDIVVPGARFRLFLGRSVGEGVDGCFDGTFGSGNAVGVESGEGAGGEESFSEETFSSKEATPEIGEVSRWVEGEPPGRAREMREGEGMVRSRLAVETKTKKEEEEPHQLLW